VSDHRAIVWVYGKGDGVGVCMNYRRFSVFLVAQTDMYILIRRHEEGL